MKEQVDCLTPWGAICGECFALLVLLIPYLILEISSEIVLNAWPCVCGGVMELSHSDSAFGYRVECFLTVH